MTEKSFRETALAEFDREIGIYKVLAETVEKLIAQILADADVQLHSITSRCKGRESFARKIDLPDKAYSTFRDVTDLAGVRITTYFGDDVDRVASRIEREFTIDVGNSTDKRKSLEPDRFGYQSLHYVAELDAGRCKLSEYKRFKNLKFEIQIRSILQHAWAEIEHDLGYKSTRAIPRQIQRRFARVSSLLEVADDEFAGIRDDLAEYSATVPAQIRALPQEVEINGPSVRALYAATSKLKYLDEVVAEVAGAKISEASAEHMNVVASRLQFLGFKTVAAIEKTATQYLPQVKRFTAAWLKEKYPSVREGVGSLYLAYVILGNQQDLAGIIRFLTEFRIGHGDREELAKRILEVSLSTR